MTHVKLAQNVRNMSEVKMSLTFGENHVLTVSTEGKDHLLDSIQPTAYNRKLLITFKRIQWALPIYYTFLKRPLTLSLGYI